MEEGGGGGGSSQLQNEGGGLGRVRLRYGVVGGLCLPC